MQSIPLMKPLQVKEIKQLGSFLDANRGEEGMNLTVLHGFLCGVLSAPESISQNDWYPYLSGLLIFQAECHILRWSSESNDLPIADIHDQQLASQQHSG